jgi:hypothetical protein
MANCAAAKVTRPSDPDEIEMIVEVVVATADPIKKTPKKLKKAPIMMAALGDMTRVDTTVAIALGASVHPLTKIEAAIRNRVKNKITFIGIILLVESNDRRYTLSFFTVLLPF